MPRGKMAASSFCHTAHAPASARSAPLRSTAQDSQFYCGFQLVSPRSRMRIQAWPVHQTRPNWGVGLRRRIDGMKDVSSHAVSKDSQRLRDWTPDEPVDYLLIKSIADSPHAVPLAFRGGSFHEADRRLTKPFPDRQSSQFLLQQIADSFSRPQTDKAASSFYSRSQTRH